MNGKDVFCLNTQISSKIVHSLHITSFRRWFLPDFSHFELGPSGELTLSLMEGKVTSKLSKRRIIFPSSDNYEKKQHSLCRLLYVESISISRVRCGDAVSLQVWQDNEASAEYELFGKCFPLLLVVLSQGGFSSSYKLFAEDIHVLTISISRNQRGSRHDS